MKMSIVLTGFMGTGKTTVGERLARLLGFAFVDMDTLLERRQGRTIRAIFETEGEAVFRRLEAALCRELAIRRHHVIATGGGALVDPENLAVFSARNLVICLDCAPEELWRRLVAAQDRPLLDGADRQARLMALWQMRQPAYARIEHHIDTTQRPLEEIVAEARALWRHYCLAQRS